MEVDVLARAETIALLCARIPALDEELADKLAAELGDLPLAAAQAAGYLEQTDLPAADYLRRFRNRRATLLARGEVLGYSGRIDTAWGLSLERLRGEVPAAVQLLQLAAFLAPEPIPLSLVRDHAAVLDDVPGQGPRSSPRGAAAGHRRRSRRPDRHRRRAGRLLPGPPSPRRLPGAPAGADGDPPATPTRPAARHRRTGAGTAGRRLPRRPGGSGQLARLRPARPARARHRPAGRLLSR